MIPILKNFLSIIRRYKLAVVLNVLGLSVAFTAFMVIMIQLNYDFSFDKCHKDHDKIFRLEVSAPQLSSGNIAIISRPLAERFFESSPYIVAGTLSNEMSSLWADDGSAAFYVENADGVRNLFKEIAVTVSPEFTDVFSFDFVEGAENALKTPDNVIIPLSISRKLFGSESAVGRQLISADGSSTTVGAVYRDFPANTIVANCIYATIPEDENKQNWGNFNYVVYVRVNDPANAPVVVENFMQLMADVSVVKEEMQGIILRLTALPDIHYVTDTLYDFAPKASKQTLMILFAIAIVIIVIAAINFTNFSTALTPMRIKNINTQRVLGARRSTLRVALVVEAIVISFLSYLVALMLVDLIHKSPLAKFVDADLSFPAQSFIIGGTALVALLTGLLAGIYPSRYMTSFAPALVLKGSFGLSPKGRKLRNTLIGIQYVASFTLIIGASFMFLQNHFMRNSPFGYEKDALMTVNIGAIQENRDAFTHQIKSYSGIEDVSYGQFLLSSSDAYMKWGRDYRGEKILFMVLPVHYTFLQMMGITITEGRDFRQEDTNAEGGVFVFNEAARKEYNLELNSSLDGGGEIIGFIPDIKFASFRMAVEPMAFCILPKDWGNRTNIAYIKLNKGAGMRDALSHVRATLAEFNSEYPFEILFYDEVLQRLYEKESSLSSLISIFSLLAIFISIVGVFGLVVFDSECRRKEIGIRKVLGATTIGIILMFNQSYFRILIICFVMASPLAWYAVHRWLENFAYKTPMYWWVYLLALLAVGIITAATVTFQTWRVASENPVRAIKSE